MTTHACTNLFKILQGSSKGWGPIASLLHFHFCISEKNQDLLVRFGYNLAHLFRDIPWVPEAIAQIPNQTSRSWFSFKRCKSESAVEMQSVPSPFCKIQYVLYFIKIQGYHFPCGMMVIKAYLHFSVFTFYILGQFDGAYRRPMDAIFFSVVHDFQVIFLCIIFVYVHMCLLPRVFFGKNIFKKSRRYISFFQIQSVKVYWPSKMQCGRLRDYMQIPLVPFVEKAHKCL